MPLFFNADREKMSRPPEKPQTSNRPAPEPLAKYFAAVLYREEEALRQAIARLESAFSPVDHLGAAHPFDQTDYYRTEMGGGLRRALVSFAALASPAGLAEAKHAAAAVEDALRNPAGNRTVNVDVGYLDLFKVVLASFKARGQKIYLGQGVWADLTLTYRGGRFHPFPWTFPDFGGDDSGGDDSGGDDSGGDASGGRYDADLLAIRERYKQQMRESGR
ncbi:MAG: DUF4416 family protein [bacterium]